MSDLNLDYFKRVRSEIEPLLPERATRVLEIGAGAGETLAWLKKRWPEAETVAIEGQSAVLPVLQKNADRALKADLEEPLPELGTFDLILALDVLEHLREPDDVLRELVARLDPGGVVIVSVPNVAHFGTLLPLLFRRRFDYVDAGTLDRTHLRFFTEHSALKLMHDAGLTVVDGVVNGLAAKRFRMLNAATFGLFTHYLGGQYVMRGQRDGNPRFRWRW